MAGDGFTSLLLWVVLAGAVAMFALTATLFLGSWAADGVLHMATRWVCAAVCCWVKQSDMDGTSSAHSMHCTSVLPCTHNIHSQHQGMLKELSS